MKHKTSAKSLSFDEFYTEAFGERWPAILAALKQDPAQAQRLNKFSKWDGELKSHAHGYVEINFSGAIPRDSDGLLASYVMDPASICVAQALKVQHEDAVLDMCAAPGGKSLILAEALDDTGVLICNELSDGRREKLTKILQQYIPREKRERIFVKGKDGGLYTKSHPEYFDRILLDAPCSGERHLLENASELAEWSVSRSERLAQRQYALLTAALICAKPGARIVYSTCALSPLENDGVIERLLKKKSEQFEILREDSWPEAESTEYGWQFLPDRCGFGPMYYCVILKK